MKNNQFNWATMATVVAALVAFYPIADSVAERMLAKGQKKGDEIMKQQKAIIESLNKQSEKLDDIDTRLRMLYRLQDRLLNKDNKID